MEQSLSELLAKSPYQVEMSLKEVLESYSHIELTEDELIEGEIWAKRQKAERVKAEELKQKEAENRKYLTGSQWTFDQTNAYMLYRANQIFEGKFKLDGQNQLVFDLLCRYFSNDEEFVSMASNLNIPNPSLSKGIMLAGNYGVGKTWMLKLFSKNQRQVFHVYNAKFIADSFEKDGEESMESYIVKIKNPYNDTAAFFQPYAGLCIDDIGTEDVKNHYGNKKNVIGDIIENRYVKHNVGIFFHATTNLTAQQLNAFYGGRVVSRLREILNFIEFNGTDRRK